MEESKGYQGNTERVLNEFKEILSLPPDKIGEVGVSVAIPTFEQSTVIELANRAKRNYMGMETLLNIERPVYVVGDIHGNIFDLIRILIMAQPPPTSRFLFLGDYVDRGQYSVECTTLLLALNIKYPDHVHLLRGNHEFERVNDIYGFKEECQSIYGNLDVYHALNEAFNYMPLAARIGKEIFAVHGGISPQISSFRQLKLVKRPIPTYDNSIACDLLWSDPSTETKEFLRSQRGNGVTFGTTAVRDFVRQFKLKHIIRAHQCVPYGIEKFAGDYVLTVFSCSNYTEGQNNRCGLIFVTMESELQLFSLPPINQIPREEALLTGSAVYAAAAGEGEEGDAAKQMDAIKRNSILTLNSSPAQRTFMFKRGSFMRLSSSGYHNSYRSARSDLSIEKKAASTLPKLKTKRPLTAEPN